MTRRPPGAVAATVEPGAPIEIRAGCCYRSAYLKSGEFPMRGHILAIAFLAAALTPAIVLAGPREAAPRRFRFRTRRAMRVQSGPSTSPRRNRTVLALQVPAPAAPDRPTFVRSAPVTATHRAARHRALSDTAPPRSTKPSILARNSASRAIALRLISTSRSPARPRTTKASVPTRVTVTMKTSRRLSM